MNEVFGFIRDVFRGIGVALNMTPSVVSTVETYPNAGWIILAITILAGASELLGQSVVLFLNRVRPGRFAVSLVLNGLILAVSFLSWGVVIWILGSIVSEQPPSLLTTLKMVGLATAPFVFGFLGLVPYLGDVIARLLYVWSLLIVARAVEFSFGLPFVQAALIAGAGWVVLLVVSSTIGRPIVALRNLIWKRLVGTPQYASAQDLLTAFAAPQGDDERRGGK